MTSSYEPFRATVLSVEIRQEIQVVRLRMGERFLKAQRSSSSCPPAPASIWPVDPSWGERFELHRAFGQESEDLITFETYDWAGSPAPQPRTEVFYQGWWTPDQFAVATDLRLVWELAMFDRTGDHEHCVLSWATIEPGMRGYRGLWANLQEVWLTVPAYEEYILRDRLRIRRSRAEGH